MSKRIVITGGAAGIGRAIAERFLQDENRVAICDADPSAVAAFQTLYPQAIAKVADVTSEAGMETFFNGIETAWQGVDVVCANAGTGGPAGGIETLQYDDWQRCIATNVHGSFLTCRWAAKLMKE